MKTSILCSALATTLIFGCGEKPASMLPGNQDRASVVLISADKQENYYCDFLPAINPSEIQKTVAGPGVKIESTTDSTFTLSTQVPLSTIDIETKDGALYTLVVEDGRNFKSGYGRLFSYAYNAEKRQLGVGFTQKPEKIIALWQNQAIPGDQITLVDDGFLINLPKLPADAPDRTYLRVYASTKEAPMSDILIPLQKGQVVTDVAQLNRHDPETQILYSLMIDRFNNGKKENDWAFNDPKLVLPQADYQGGDIVGITQKINEGFFEKLGINTLWISPITQNPYTAWGENVQPHTKFSAYHGYWPIYITKPEERFTTEEELRAMLQTAHDHGMNVILDYVANHLHIQSPLFQAHPEWATDSVTADGRPNLELWDGDYRLTTWFDKHIPSLQLDRMEIADQLTDSALFWVRNYDFDGYRHDACKHIPLNYWRLFTHKMKTDPQLKDRRLWMIGETYGEPALIGSYVKTGMLNAQFDFNVYHCAIDVFSNHSDQNMQSLAETIDQSGAAYGSHHTMGNISGNHDKARFVSLAGGDLKWEQNDKYEGWNRHVGIGDSVRGYAKQLLLNKLNLTIPGVPCIYQGDEYGQEGANDPDNRRMMRFSGYNHFEQHNLDEVCQLAQLRRQSLALQLGDYLPLITEPNVLVFLRSYLGKGILVGINNADTPYDGEVQLPALLGGEKVKLHIAPNDVCIFR